MMYLMNSLVLLALLSTAAAFAPLHAVSSTQRLVSDSLSPVVLFGKDTGKNKKKNKGDDEEEMDVESVRRKLEMQWKGHSLEKKKNGIGAPRYSSLLGPPPPHPASGGPMGGSGPMNDLGARHQPYDWIDQRTTQENQEWRRFGQQETEEWKLRNGYQSPIPMQPQYHQPRPRPSTFGGMSPPQEGFQTAHEQVHEMPPGKSRSAREQMFRIHNQLKSHPAFADDVLFGPNKMRIQEQQPQENVDFYRHNEEFVDEWIQQDFERFGPPGFGEPEWDMDPRQQQQPTFGPAAYHHPQNQQRPGFGRAGPPHVGRQTAHEQIHPMPRANDRSARDQMFRLHYQLKNHPSFADDALFGPQDSNDDERNPRGFNGPPMFDDEEDWGHGSGFNRGPGPMWTP